ncbi:hypothetical protein ABZ746_25405 [Streptomyces sp. NPDC020096]|jgi:hypothetical protein
MDTARPQPELPEPGFAHVRIVAASPEAARQIAAVLRRSFASTEQRSYPADSDGNGTRLHVTVDTARTPDPGQPFRPWLVTDGPRGADHPHADEV